MAEEYMVEIEFRKRSEDGTPCDPDVEPVVRREPLEDLLWIQGGMFIGLLFAKLVIILYRKNVIDRDELKELLGPCHGSDEEVVSIYKRKKEA